MSMLAFSWSYATVRYCKDAYQAGHTVQGYKTAGVSTLTSARVHHCRHSACYPVLATRSATLSRDEGTKFGKMLAKRQESQIHDQNEKKREKKKDFTRSGQPTRLITGTNHRNHFRCS